MSDQTALENERDFLLRSLDDLEAERDAGNIDDDTYRSLHDDYTARAAVVIRSLRDDVARRPSRGTAYLAPARRSSRSSLIVVFAGVTAVRRSACGRDTVAWRDHHGKLEQRRGRPERRGRLVSLAEAAAAKPDDYEARIAYARMLLGSDLAAALQEFDAAARARPEPARAADLYRVDQRIGRGGRANPVPIATRCSRPRRTCSTRRSRSIRPTATPTSTGRCSIRRC